MPDNKNPYQTFEDRIKDKKAEREEWEKIQRSSYYDRQAIYGDKDHINGSQKSSNTMPTNKNDVFTNWLMVGELHREKMLNKVQQATISRKTENDYELERISQIPQDPKSKTYYRVGNGDLSDWALLEKQNNLNDKAIKLMEDNYGTYNSFSKNTAAVASMLFGAFSSQTSGNIALKAEVERRELGKKVQHIEDLEKRTDSFYEARFQNMHLNNGFASNKAIRNLNVGEKPSYADKWYLSVVNEQNVNKLPIGVLPLNKINELSKNKNDHDVLSELLNQPKQPQGHGVLLQDKQSQIEYNLNDWVRRQNEKAQNEKIDINETSAFKLK